MLRKFTIFACFCLFGLASVSLLNADQSKNYKIVLLDQAEKCGVAGVLVGFFADGAYVGLAVTDKHGIATLEMKPSANWKAVHYSLSENDERVICEVYSVAEQKLIICSIVGQASRLPSKSQESQVSISLIGGWDACPTTEYNLIE